MRPIRLLAGASCLAAAGHFVVAEDLRPEALAGVLSGDAAGDAETNPQCKLFTPDEISGYVGEPVAAGANAGMGLSCQWLAVGSDADAMITVVPSEYAERPTLAPGFEAVASLGPDGFAVPEFDGWAAGVTRSDSFVKASVAGSAATKDKAVDLLREALSRLGG